jgi:hypothetical protein
MTDAKNQKLNFFNETSTLLVRTKGVPADEVYRDVEFRRRLAELIERALKRH